MEAMESRRLLFAPLDASFGTEGVEVVDAGDTDEWAKDVVVQPDGKVVVSGTGGAGLNLLRFLPDGTPDASFGSGGRTAVAGNGWGVALRPDGKILGGGGPNFSLSQFFSDGSPDASFGAAAGTAATNWGTSYVAYDFALQPDGKIVLAGNNSRDVVVARLNANGSLDGSFGSAGRTLTDFAGSYDKGYAVRVQGDGRIVVAGRARDAAGDYDFAAARYLPDGSPDPSFGTGGKVRIDMGDADDAAFGLDVRADGKITLAGRTRPSDATGYDFAVLRLNADGSPDAGFGTDGRKTINFGYGADYAYSILSLPGGKTLIAGRASTAGTGRGTDFGIARLNDDGSLDATYGSGGLVLTDLAGGRDDYAEALAPAPGGGFYLAGGAGGNVDGDFALARYRPETSAGGRTHAVSGAASTNEGSLYTLTLSPDPAAGVSRWTVNWGDGSIISLPGNVTLAQHTYGDGGDYTILAGATDDAGFYDEAPALAVSVADVAPTLIALAAPAEVQPGAIYYPPLATFTDPGFGPGETYAATIDWGDGTAPEPARVEMVAGSPGTLTTGRILGDHHVYAEEGAYAVTASLQEKALPAATAQTDARILAANAYLTPGEIGTMTAVTFTLSRLQAEARADNELSVFVVDDALGRLNGILPGSPGYLDAATGNATRTVAFASADDDPAPAKIAVPAGSYLGFYLVWNGTTQTAQASNPTNALLDTNFGPNIWFPQVTANPDGFGHFREGPPQPDGNVRYEVEDRADDGGITRRSDRDFNDLVFDVSASAAPGAPNDTGFAPGLTAFYWSITGEEDQVPDDLEDTTGVGLFAKLEDGGDDSAGLDKPIPQDDPFPGEVTPLVLTQPDEAGYEYRLERSDASLLIFADAAQTQPILGTGSANQSAPLNFNGQKSRRVYVRRASVPNFPRGIVRFQHREPPVPVFDPNNPPPLPAWSGLDDVAFTRETRLVIAIGGHSQSDQIDTDGDGKDDAFTNLGRRGKLNDEAGTNMIARNLRRLGYVVQTFAEDPGDDDLFSMTIHPEFGGDGVNGRTNDTDPKPHFFWGAYNMVVHMANRWNLKELGLIGYSHGASSIRLLTHRLQTTYGGGNWPLDLKFTGYIDAVRLPRDNEAFPFNDDPDAPGSVNGFDVEYAEEEYRFPYRTDYHVNIFQRKLQDPDLEDRSGAFDLRGGPTTGTHGGPSRTDDAAGQDSNFNRPLYQVNINAVGSRYFGTLNFPQDPFFDNPNNIPFFDVNDYADYDEIDHTNGLGGGADHPSLTSGANKAIDDHPVVQAYITYHLRRAFGEII